MRTHYCGQLNAGLNDQIVTLCGWAHRRRDHGGVIFIDLRDREGICQVVARPEVSKEAHDAADRVRSEYVLAVTGEVTARSADTVNDKIPYQSGIVSPAVSGLLNAGSNSTNSAVSSLLGSGGLQSLTSQIQHEDVQLRLKMKPQINEGGNVRLTLELEKDDKGATDPTLGPSFLKRTVKSDIVAKDQGTIVIGGLIQETESRAVSKVPVLGSLPVLGALFRSTDTVKNKTNLLVFLTPYIIRDDGDYRRIFEKKQKELAQFRAQFYGKRKGYEPDIDFSRKASPLSRLHQGVVEETSRAENGGPGLWDTLF